jgi:hypothetical protein
MDESFQLRAHRLLDGGRPARLDFSMLTAILSAQAASSAAARAQARAAPPAEPVGEIVLAGPAWREAVSAQRGCFNRAEARRRCNVS